MLIAFNQKVGSYIYKLWCIGLFVKLTLEYLVDTFSYSVVDPLVSQNLTGHKFLYTEITAIKMCVFM